MSGEAPSAGQKEHRIKSIKAAWRNLLDNIISGLEEGAIDPHIAATFEVAVRSATSNSMHDFLQLRFEAALVSRKDDDYLQLYVRPSP